MGRSRRAVIFAFAAAALAGALAGCETVSGDYMPLAVGNRWEYSVDWHRAAAPPQAATDFIEITQKVGRASYRARELGLTTLWAKEQGYLTRSDGRWREGVLLLPPHTGYKWRVNTTGGARFYEIVGREDVTVPAGKFSNCVKVTCRSLSGKRYLRRWFARDIGMVKLERLYDGKRVETKMLTGCRIRKGPAPASAKARGDSPPPIPKRRKPGEPGGPSDDPEPGMP